MGPILSSAWDRNNEGKLFKHVESDVAARTRAQLAELRAERLQRENEKAAAVAASLVDAPISSENTPFNSSLDERAIITNAVVDDMAMSTQPHSQVGGGKLSPSS